MGLTGIPIGPTWHSKFFFGADPNGRDVAVRLLYGGRTSLEIGALATIITMVGAVDPGRRRRVLPRLGRHRDLAPARPDLGLSRRCCSASRWASAWRSAASTSACSRSRAGRSSSPPVVIGVVYIPYVARPVRGEVLSLREREFVDAARILGYGRFRIMVSEILPNLFSTLIVFFALQTGSVDRARGRPVLPRRRRAAAQRVLGHDARRRHAADHERGRTSRWCPASCSWSPCWPSTSSATVCDRRSIRGRASERGAERWPCCSSRSSAWPRRSSSCSRSAC